ncbi:MAG: DUF1570 domain-containing protein [Phycisphaerae bacterium]|nr:DUF1570 domain-containing protein [Phycisphaerae bacterium]
MTKKTRQQCAVCLLLLLGPAGALRAADDLAAEQTVRCYVSPHYLLYTDLPERDAREALERLTAMYELYRRFAPAPDEGLAKLPVYLYRRFEKYRQSFRPGERLNAGRYDGVALRAVLDGETFSPPDVWRVIQHEGWHQYSHRLLGRSASTPLWLEEGLAEYFAAAVWKDGELHTGTIDVGAYVLRGEAIVLQPGRLQRVQTRIRTGQFRPLEKLVTMSPDEWRQQVNPVNHDQVWSFTHFLLHAGQGRRRESLKAYLADVLRDPPAEPEKALAIFRTHFGGDPADLQNEYESWWLAQPVPPEVE